MTRRALPLLVLTLLLVPVQGCLSTETLKDAFERDTLSEGPRTETRLELEASECLGLRFAVRVNLTALDAEIRDGFQPHRENGWGKALLTVLSCREVHRGGEALGGLNLTVASLAGEATVESPGLQSLLLSMAGEPGNGTQALADAGVPISTEAELRLEVERTHDIVDRVDGELVGGPMPFGFQGTAVSIDSEVWPTDRWWSSAEDQGLRVTVAHETQRLGGISGEVHAPSGSPLADLLPERDEFASGRYTDSNLTLEVETVPLRGGVLPDLGRFNPR